MTLQSLWSQMSGITLGRYIGTMTVPVIDGQSLALGRNGSVEQRRDLTYRCRDGVKQLTGLRRSDDLADIYVHGPGTLGYTEAHATGMIPAYPTGNAPAVLTFALALDRWRRELGSPLRRMVVGFNGISGQSIIEFDHIDDGAFGTKIRDNHARWYSEVRNVAPAAPLVYGMIQGEADINMSREQYRAAATRSYRDALDDIEAQFGRRPPMMIWQTGGYTDSTGKLDGSPLAQLDLVADFKAIFAGPLYPIKLYDNQVHPDMQSQIDHTEIAAWRFAQYERGEGVNFLPGRPEWNGNVVRIPFPEPLAFDPDDKYADYGGLTNHGVEVSDAVITSVTLDGNAVVVTCDAPPSQVQIALQSQDVKSYVDAEGKNYPAHRCDIMAAATLDSLMTPGLTLKRFIPSCRFARP